MRSWLYRLVRAMGDVAAIRRGPRAIGKRMERRVLGRIAGRIIGALTR